MIEFEAVVGGTAPDTVSSDDYGPAVCVPTGTLAASANIVTAGCRVLGWSFREATGLGGAIAELLNGGDDNSPLIGVLGLDTGFDPAASQTPAAQTTQGANSAIVASIGGVAGTLVFITSLRISGLGATAATEVQAGLGGVLGTTITYGVTVPAGVTTAIAPVVDSFGGRGLPASATGQAISLNVPAFGAGNTFAQAEVQGYIQTAANAADTQWFGDRGLGADAGVRVRVISGSVRGSVWIRA